MHPPKMFPKSINSGFVLDLNLKVVSGHFRKKQLLVMIMRLSLQKNSNFSIKLAYTDSILCI